MLNGYNTNYACVSILPMLGRKISEYPRFRGCFVENDTILIFTGVGGNNRNQGYGEDRLMKDKNFISTWDDEVDSTCGYYAFSVPKKWKSDFKKITSGNIKGVSDKYVEYVKKFYDNNPMIDIIFGRGMKKE